MHSRVPSIPPAELPIDLIPIKRPHYELRGRELFFLLSRRPGLVLDADDVALWNRIDGVTTVRELELVVPRAAERLKRFWEAHVCELAERSPPTTLNRSRVLVLEAHMDDAVLSVGGLMWLRRAQCRFTVVTIAGRSNYTSYYELDRDFFDVARVSRLRAAESSLALRLVHGEHCALDGVEAPLRLRGGNWTLDWYRAHRKLVDAFIMHAAPDEEIESWASAIEGMLRSTDADEVWLPLGVGTHVDHELARNACLRALSRVPDLARRIPVYCYQDVPYAAQFPHHTERIVDSLHAAGARLERCVTDISQSLEAKARLASVFASQFKPEYVRPLIEESAHRAGGQTGRPSELRFKVERLPGIVDPLAAYSRGGTIESLVPRVRAWYERHRDAEAIRILSPVPFARWRDDLALVLERFPHAHLEIHVSVEYADETTQLESPRVDVRVVHGREMTWLAHLARLARSRARPTVVLTGEGLARFAGFVRIAFPRSDLLVATRMNDVVLALRALGQVRS